MAKHDWNSLQHYLEIHFKTLRLYQKYMETPRFYAHKVENELSHSLVCPGIIFLTYRQTRVRAEIEKYVEIDPSNPFRSRARTYAYTYNANIVGGEKLIRYCSPHQDWEKEGSAPHHRHHHKHDFTKNSKGDVQILGDDNWPHVGEFFEEVLGRF